MAETTNEQALFERQGAASRTIIIIGGGIAGLTTALCLTRIGYRALVLEAKPGPATEGAGIQVSPNAYSVLSQLGLSRVLWTSGFAPSGVNVRGGKSGDLLSRMPFDGPFRERYDSPYLVLHRADLLQALLGVCETDPDIDIRYGVSFQDVAVHKNGVTVLGHGDGRMSEYRGRSVIGADGVASAVRAHVPGAAQPVFTGDIAWRALLNPEAAPAEISLDETTLWLGPSSHLVTYPVRGGTLLNVVAIARWREKKVPDSGWYRDLPDESRLRAFRSWRDPLRELVAAPAAWGAWPLYACTKVKPACEGPICLIGDAAHAMLPYAAQGGASAIEDAWVLARALGDFSDDHEAAWAEFWKRRRNRLDKLAKLARSNRQVYHLSWPMRSIVHSAMRRMSNAQLMRRMDWVYNWEAE